MSEGQSIFDKAKDMADNVKDKVGGMVGKHEEKIDSAVEQTGDFVDDKTGGRFSEQVDRAQDAVTNAVENLGDEEPESQPGQESQGLL